MTHFHTIDSNSLQAYRYRVHLLAQELWQEKNPLKRLNISLQLADATTHLARLEAETLQEKYGEDFNRILTNGEQFNQKTLSPENSDEQSNSYSV